MTPVTCMAGRKIALFGLGGSGFATALALKAGGADVLAGDDSPASLAKAEAAGIRTADLLAADWTGIAALVLSPGVPLTHKDGRPYTHPVVARARAAGAEVIGDIELFCRERAKIAPNAPFVAITGTNGKSTTTALVAHILREAGRDVQMGGNIGTPILALEPPANDRVHVIEMSSFQIDLTPSFGSASNFPSRHAEEAGEASRLEARTTAVRASRRAFGAPQHDETVGTSSGIVGGPTVGVLLNITPDHLDRHGTMENYAGIKRRVADSAGFAVIGLDDPITSAIADDFRGVGRIYRLFSTRQCGPEASVYLDGTVLRLGTLREERVADLAEVRTLRGRHNAQNAAAAVAVIAGFTWFEELRSEVPRLLSTFPGLAHRMEEVARIGRTLFVNDSKATNADSAEKALLSFHRVHWILGGKPKEGGIEPLRPLFTKVVKAYLIGDATEVFAATLEGAVPVSRCGTLDVAVAEAARDAARSDAKEPVVLLSPACASYDQYPNFEIRGDRFRDLVRALPGAIARS